MKTDHRRTRKTKNLRNNTDLNVLTFRTKAKVSGRGKRDASFVLEKLISLPKGATKYKK